MSETLTSKTLTNQLIVAFIGKVSTRKIERENFDESLTVRQNSSDFSTVKVLRYTVLYVYIFTLQRDRLATINAITVIDL